MKIHPLAKKVPPLTREEFARLRESVANGFDTHTPIITHEGMILDGRHRADACEKEGVKPVYEPWRPINKTDTPAKFVMRRTIHRSMTHAQRAALAADILPELKREAEQREKAGKSDPAQKVAQGRAIDIAAAETGTNRAYVAVAKKVKEQSPAMFKAMQRGEVSMSQAAKSVKAPPKPVPKVRTAADKALAAAPLFRELVNETNALRRKVEDLAGTAAGAELAKVLTTIKFNLNNLAEALKFKAPHAACPYGPNCEVGCKACGGRKWVGRGVWDAIPDGIKK